MTLRTERIRSLDDVRAFLEGNEAADITLHDRQQAYAFIERTLVRLRYHFGLSRAGKGLVRRFLAKGDRVLPGPASRLIARQRRTGGIRDRRSKSPARPFRTVYTPGDALPLAEVDEAFGQLSGPATKEILRRQHEVFGDERFARLARISNGHIYNLRQRRSHRRARTTFRKTWGAPSSIGARRKPRPEGRPGFGRVDTVHTGDRDGEKGVYIINAVDEVTQYQQLAAVPRVTELHSRSRSAMCRPINHDATLITGADRTGRRPPGGFDDLGSLPEDRLVPGGLADGGHGLLHTVEPYPCKGQRQRSR